MLGPLVAMALAQARPRRLRTQPRCRLQTLSSHLELHNLLLLLTKPVDAEPHHVAGL